MIDGGVFLGEDPTVGIGSDANALMERLGEINIDQALAVSFEAIYYDYRRGNQSTLDICAQSKGGLLPVASINLVGYDCTSDYIAELARAGFLGLSLFPHLQPWDWNHYALHRLAENAAEAGLFVQPVVQTASDLSAMTRALAGIDAPVLVRWMRRGGYNNLADMLAVGLDHHNFYFDIGSVTQSGGIKLLADRLGADRLYCASNAPLAYETCATYLLAAADLSDGDRDLVEHGNLTKIINTKPISSAQNLTENQTWKEFRDRPKIDTHWHTGTWNLIEPCLDAAAMQREFDRYNYQAVITSSILALNSDMSKGNAETLDFIEADERVFGLVVINPLQPEDSLKEIEKYRAHPRFVGIKSIQDFYAMGLDDDGYRPMIQAVSGTDWPLMAHLPGMANAARNAPDTGFVAAHCTWNYDDLVPLSNVWFDIATSTPFKTETDIKRLINTVGEDRIIFSSDGQLMNPAWTIGKLSHLGMQETTQKKIFMSNALHAFPRLATHFPKNPA
jgi:predicted TIM-barrel fold metal-dependent hydrolase